ncbi:MAG: hypothetical protein RLZZ01_1303 [Actinomycetota bacterium]|jgi:hypothetical protein
MPEDQTPTTNDDVRTVFELWQETLCARPRRLDDKRRRLIRRAIDNHGLDECLDAVRGCSVSDWHMGKNPQRKKYTDIELILRDAKHIEMFADTWHAHQDDDTGTIAEARRGVTW